MAITDNETAFVAASPASISLSAMFTVTPGSTDPTYLVLSVLDRNEYTTAATGATGSLSGNGATLGLSSTGGDERGTGIVFTYDPSTGRYYSSTYGYLDQLIYTSSPSAYDVTNLSLFGTSSLMLANTFATNPNSMMQMDPAGYLGSATVVTQPGYTGSVPSQATPDSIVAAANSFIGQAWNENGCWVLASAIAADAGAGLPMQSTLTGMSGQPNGEWIVAFNGPTGQTGDWQDMVTAGEMIVFQTASGEGHITTCVSGSGSTAMLVDNITYVSSSGQVTNAASDGSSSDIIIAPPHLASQEFASVSASSVVIYELDTPTVTAAVPSDSLAAQTSQSLAPLFSATDPANHAITAWQVYNTAASDALVLDGTDYSNLNATDALSTTDLANVALLAGATATTDTLEVRAYNGAYWGDWTALSVTVTGPAAPPVLTAQTPNQTWKEGQVVALTLPANTFTDPSGAAMTYAAALSNGQALPSWLHYNAATDSFSGTPPNTAQTLNITVTATDPSGSTASETFAATVLGTPLLTAQTANQTWTEGSAVSLTLGANTFIDPQGEALTYTAMQQNGQALPSWLKFNAATETFSGTAPKTAQTVTLKVTATDSSGLSASETFTATVAAATSSKGGKGGSQAVGGITVSNPTPNTTWTDGAQASLTVPASTFSDALGLKMSFSGYQVSGPDASSWLHFNAATDTFSGTVPKTASGTIALAVIATDAQNMTAEDLFSVTFAPGVNGHTAIVTAGAMLQQPDLSTMQQLLALPN